MLKDKIFFKYQTVLVFDAVYKIKVQLQVQFTQQHQPNLSRYTRT